MSDKRNTQTKPLAVILNDAKDYPFWKSLIISKLLKQNCKWAITKRPTPNLESVKANLIFGDFAQADLRPMSMTPEFQYDGLRSNRDDNFIDRTTKPFFIGASWWTFLLLSVIFESFGFEPPASHLELWAVLFILLGLFCSQPQVSYPESRVVSPCFQIVLLQAEDLSSLGRSLHIFEPYCSQTTGLLSRGSSPLFDFLMF